MVYLRNYAVLNVKDQLAKITGVGSVQLFGSGDYAMRIWLNPRKVAERGLTPQDVVAAVRSQNQQVSAGVIGGPPYHNDVGPQLPVQLPGRAAGVGGIAPKIGQRRPARGGAPPKERPAHRDAA